MQINEIMIYRNVGKWSPWHRVRILAVDLFGAVTVEPEDNQQNPHKKHTFSKKEAEQVLVKLS